MQIKQAELYGLIPSTGTMTAVDTKRILPFNELYYFFKILNHTHVSRSLSCSETLCLKVNIMHVPVHYPTSPRKSSTIVSCNCSSWYIMNKWLLSLQLPVYTVLSSKMYFQNVDKESLEMHIKMCFCDQYCELHSKNQRNIDSHFVLFIDSTLSFISF